MPKTPAVEVKPGQVWADKAKGRVGQFARFVKVLACYTVDARVVPVRSDPTSGEWRPKLGGPARSIRLDRFPAAFRLVQDAPATPEVQDD